MDTTVGWTLTSSMTYSLSPVTALLANGSDPSHSLGRQHPGNYPADESSGVSSLKSHSSGPGGVLRAGGQ